MPVIGTLGPLAVVDLTLVTKHGYAKVTCDEDGAVTDPKVDNDPFCHGNNDDCVDETVARSAK